MPSSGTSTGRGGTYRRVGSPTSSQPAIQQTATMPSEARRAIDEATTTSDLEVARKGARLLYARLIETERKLLMYKDRACVAESIILSLEASKRDRRKTGAKRPEDDWPQFPSQIVKEGQAIRKSAFKAAKVYFTFFSPYAPSHVWAVQEPGWSWNDASVRFDTNFPNNRKIGQALEFMQAVDQRGLEWVKRGTAAYREQFEGSLATARSESIKRVRDNGAEIFEDLKDRVNAGFAQLLRDNAEPLTYHLPKQEPVILTGFGNSLFLHESSGARRLLPGVADIVGIWEDDQGNFESSPLDAELIYKHYKVVPGEEFQSELLFRTARCLLYGVKSMRKRNGLIFDKRSQLKGVPLSVTPGLIVGIVTLARIAFSPESIFSGDGKGPLTKVQFDGDADEMLETLMSIWNEPGGRKIRDAWMVNVFPSLANTQSTLTESTERMPNAAPKRRGNTAAQIIARNREATRTEAPNPPQPAPDHEYDSYHIPEDSFYVDHSMRHVDASVRYEYNDFVTSFMQADDDDDDDDDGAGVNDNDNDNDNVNANDTETSFHFDEDAGDVLSIARSTPIVVEPHQHASSPEDSFLMPSPPRQARPLAPPTLVPAVPRRNNAQVLPPTVISRSNQANSAGSAGSLTSSHAQLAPRHQETSKHPSRRSGSPKPHPSKPVSRAPTQTSTIQRISAMSRQSDGLQAPSSRPLSRAPTPAPAVQTPPVIESPPTSIVTKISSGGRADGGNTRRSQIERSSPRAEAPTEAIPIRSHRSSTRVTSAQDNDPSPAPPPPPVTRRATRSAAAGSVAPVGPIIDTLAGGVARLSVVAADNTIQGVPSHAKVGRGRVGGGSGTKSKKRGAGSGV